jgi:hypothetical protein
MTHDEVYIYFKALAPSLAVKALCWYPCGLNTIRLVFKEGPEFCFTVGGSSKRDYHIRTYAEWFEEEFPEDPEKSYQAWRAKVARRCEERNSKV